MSFQDTIGKYFKSWDDIKKQRDIFVFACGLATNPTTMVERMSELYVDEFMERLIEVSSFDYDFGSPDISDDFISIARDITESSISPFCNRFLHYVLQPSFPMSSKLHIFDQEIPDVWTEDLYQKTLQKISSRSPNNDNPQSSCSIFINDPYMEAIDVLDTISNLDQTILNLCINRLRVDAQVYSSDKRVFKMDSNANMVLIGYSGIPSSVMQNLAEDSSYCFKMKTFAIEDASHVKTGVNRIQGLTCLSTLILNYCGLSSEHTSILCEELKSLMGLEILELNENPIGSKGALKLAESIKNWGEYNSLWKLELKHCSICKPGSSVLMDSLSSCKDMVDLFLSGNKIENEGAECLARSIMAWEQQGLRDLYLEDCGLDWYGSFAVMKALDMNGLDNVMLRDNNNYSLFEKLIEESSWKLRLCELDVTGCDLSEEDVQALASLLYNKRFDLDRLYFSYNMDDMELESEETLKALRTISSVRVVRIDSASDWLDKDDVVEKLNAEERRRRNRKNENESESKSESQSENETKNECGSTSGNESEVEGENE